MSIDWAISRAVDASRLRNDLAIRALDTRGPVAYALTGDTIVIVIRHNDEPTEILQCKIVATGTVVRD